MVIDMRLIIDRIEGNFAVCETEDMSIVNIPISDFSFEVQEGNVLIFENGIYAIDEEYESARRAKLFALQNSIFDE